MFNLAGFFYKLRHIKIDKLKCQLMQFNFWNEKAFHPLKYQSILTLMWRNL